MGITCSSAAEAIFTNPNMRLVFCQFCGVLHIRLVWEFHGIPWHNRLVAKLSKIKLTGSNWFSPCKRKITMPKKNWRNETPWIFAKCHPGILAAKISHCSQLTLTWILRIPAMYPCWRQGLGGLAFSILYNTLYLAAVAPFWNLLNSCLHFLPLLDWSCPLNLSQLRHWR